MLTYPLFILPPPLLFKTCVTSVDIPPIYTSITTRMSERMRFIVSAVLVMVALAALILGLTFGLATPALDGGGSPDGPFPPDSSNDPPTGMSVVHFSLYFVL